nr:hypothetical protein BaRGS_030280 [Batillaria attramentaria]
MAVVQGADLKQNLKDSGIKVAADLTKRQRAEIERVRSEGKFGYYKNGRLHVEDRRTPRDEQDPRERPDQRPSLDEEDERDAGDRQQQGIPLTLHVELGTDTARRTGHNTETPAEQLTGDCDESSGDFTFMSPTGNSVVDYL